MSRQSWPTFELKTVEFDVPQKLSQGFGVPGLSDDSVSFSAAYDNPNGISAETLKALEAPRLITFWQQVFMFSPRTRMFVKRGECVGHFYPVSITPPGFVEGECLPEMTLNIVVERK